MKKTPLFLISICLLASLILSACASSADLADTTWKLVSYGSASNPTSAVEDVETNLTFGKDGKIGGTVGCNSFSGDFTATDKQLTISPLASTMMACADPLMQQEAGTFFVLTGTVNYAIAGDTLTITSTDGASMLVFKK
jgi:heat shock protein HslJ